MSNEVKVKIIADPAGFNAAMSEAAAAVSRSTQSMRSNFQGIGDQASQMGKHIGLAVGGMVTAFGLAIRHAINYQDEMSKAAQSAGVSTETFSELAYVARLADVNVSELARTFAKLSTTLQDARDGQKEAVELLSRLKIDPKGIKDGDELLMALAERFEQMNDGARKTALAIDVFGERVGPRLIPFLNQGRAGIEGLREEARKLGVVVTTEAGKAAEELNDNLTRLKSAVGGAAAEIARELTPSLVKASEFFVKATKESGLFQGTLISIGALIAKGLGIDDVGKLESRLTKLRENLALAERNLVEMSREKGDTAKGVADILREKVNLLRQEIMRTSVELARLNAGNPEAGAGRGFINPPAVKGPGFEPDPKARKEKKEESSMPRFDEMLAEARRAATELDAIHGLSKDQELAFWREIRDTTKLTQSDQIAVAKKISEARIAMLRETAQQQQQVEGLSLERSRDKLLAQVDLEEQASRELLATKEITAETALALDQEYEDRRYAIRRAAMEAARSVLDPQRDPVAVAQINAELQALELQHQMRMMQIRGQISAQSASEVSLIWEGIASRVGGLWDQGVQALINGTLTLSGALRAIGAEIVRWFAIDVVKPMVMTWLFGEHAKTGATTAGSAARIAAETLAAAKSVALWAATAVKNIMASAWEAMAAAWKAIVGIPYIGPVLAPAAAAVAFGGVAALAGRVASAEGGFDIPRGLNPLTQLHEKEMVLPKGPADVIRAMAAGRGGEPREPTVINQHNTFMVQGAVDRRSQDQIFAEVYQAMSTAASRNL